MDEPADRSQPMEPPSHLQPDGRYRPDDRLWLPLNSYGWTYHDQDRFEALWTTEGDKVADQLADRYGYGWPYLIAQSIAASAPDLYQTLMQYATGPDAPDVPSKPWPDDVMYEHIAIQGSFHVLRKRRTWAEPSEITCATCSRKFWSGDLAHWEYKRYGPARFCSECTVSALTGYQGPWISSQDAVIEAVRRLSDALGIIPPENYPFLHFPPDAQDEDRDKWMGALILTPSVQHIKETLGCKDWFAVLQRTQLVGQTWRPAGSRYGTYCRGEDGHLCRSLLEKAVDDWLADHGVDHEREPPWPYHAMLNANGKKRADWLLPDGSYVECLGLAENSWYDLKTEQKRKLAREVGIKLYLIYPDDILRLERVFADIQNKLHDCALGGETPTA